MPGKNTSYWNNITETIQSVYRGMKITMKHLLGARKSQRVRAISESGYFDHRNGIATIQYPHQMQPVPDTGRYRLHNEIDDCIVCDKCAKVCPVDCIDIEPIRATEEIGKTSDGTPKRIYAATFDIDMGKCCFCGLCTTVCPTECLTMTKVYDFSVTDIREHTYVFAEMSEAEITEKKKKFEEYQQSKSSASATPLLTEDKTESSVAPKPAKPVFKPKIKPTDPAAS
jgi:formate hydrogenlyase subunit 6/NADH:ubiquinone oxidoreductase subunit I